MYGDLLSPTGVGREFHISPHTLQYWRSQGKGPRFIKVRGQIGRRGGRVVYRRAAVEAWLQNRPTGGEVIEGGTREAAQ